MVGRGMPLKLVRIRLNDKSWFNSVIRKEIFSLLKSAFLYSQTFLIYDLFSKQGIFIFIKVAS
jgi:hypothetical protein